MYWLVRYKRGAKSNCIIGGYSRRGGMKTGFEDVIEESGWVGDILQSHAIPSQSLKVLVIISIVC